jgi:hypothetical protein
MAVHDDAGEAFYELEAHVRDLGRRAHRPPGAFPGTPEIFVRVTGPARILYLQFGAEAELRLPRGYVVERDADFLSELQLPVA